MGYNARQQLYVIDEWVTMHGSDCMLLMSGLQCTTVIVVIDDWVTMHSSDCMLLMSGFQSTTAIVRD